MVGYLNLDLTDVPASFAMLAAVLPIFCSQISFLQDDKRLYCAQKCRDKDDCDVLTGHSQGGATAILASILLYSRNPTTITFGQPLAVRRNCDLINSERVYRYVNSMFIDDNDDKRDREGVYYDPIPLLPTLGQRRGHYGYYLLLADDTEAVKY